MNLALIPARGGSKRIPGKNVRSFAGRPIIDYSIRAARASRLFEQIIVSTDSEEIASVARDLGAAVPFRRPAELSDDVTPLADVAHHALAWARGEEHDVSGLCVILPTAPFVQVEDLAEGHRLLEGEGVDSAFSVTTFAFPVQRALRIGADGALQMLWPEHELTRSNDLPAAYHDAGQFYWLAADRFYAQRRIYTPDARPVVLPRERVQDIDTPEDWRRAELMYAALREAGEIQ